MALEGSDLRFHVWLASADLVAALRLDLRAAQFELLLYRVELRLPRFRLHAAFQFLPRLFLEFV